MSGQGKAFSNVSLEERVPADHPLRAIRRMSDEVFEKIRNAEARSSSADFGRLGFALWREASPCKVWKMLVMGDGPLLTLDLLRSGKLSKEDPDSPASDFGKACDLQRARSASESLRQEGGEKTARLSDYRENPIAALLRTR